MNNRSYLAFALLLFFILKTSLSFGQSLPVLDTLDLKWTQLEGPPAYVLKYATGNGILHAASEEALFSSTDEGLHWTYNLALGRKRIKRLFAKDHAIVLITQEPKKVDPGASFSSVELHQVLHSSDDGQTWEAVLVFYQEPESFGSNETYEIFAANDSTLLFNYLLFPTQSAGIIQTWISKNNGASWTQTIENAGLLHASRDTISFVKAGMSVPKGMISGVNDLANPQAVDLSATGSTWANLKKVFYQNGVYYLFQNDKTLWRSNDLGTSWLSETLAFSGDLKDVIWADSVFFITSTDGVYKATTNNPTAFLKIYNGQQSLLKAVKTFTPLSSGYWLNNDLNQTLFSADSGQSWEARSKGLSSKIGAITSICDQILARSLGAQTDYGGWYLSDNQAQNWTLQTDPVFYQFENYLELYLGEIDGFIYQYKPTKVQRSYDCGQTWDNLDLYVTGQPTGLTKHQNRLFLYTKFDVRLLYSDDNGITWLEGEVPDYNLIKLISAGNSLYAFYNGTSYVSDDLGVSWQQRPHPMGTGRVFYMNEKLVAYDGPSYNDTTHIFHSTDAGTNWSIAQTIPPPVGGLSTLFVPDSNVLLLHHNYALYVSDNAGEFWSLIQPLPFTKRVSIYDDQGFISDSLVLQGSRYMIDQKNLYAATEAHGLWSTPIDSFLQNPDLHSALKDLPEITQKHFSIQPNPANAETWVIASEALDSKVNISILGTSGQVWRTWENANPSKNGFRLELNNLPKGLYFLEIVGSGFVETLRIFIN